MSGGLQPEDAAGPGVGGEAPIVVIDDEVVPQGLADDVVEVEQGGNDQGGLLTVKERENYLTRLVYAGTANQDLIQRVWQAHRDLDNLTVSHAVTVREAEAKWEELRQEHTTEREEEYFEDAWWAKRVHNAHLRYWAHWEISQQLDRHTVTLRAQEAKAASNLEQVSIDAKVIGLHDRLRELRRHSDHSAAELNEVTKHVILLELEVENHCLEVKEAGVLKVHATRRLNYHLGRVATESSEYLRLKFKYECLQTKPYNEDPDSDIGEIDDYLDASSSDEEFGSSEQENLLDDIHMEDAVVEGQGDHVEDVDGDDSRPSTSQR